MLSCLHRYSLLDISSSFPEHFFFISWEQRSLILSFLTFQLLPPSFVTSINVHVDNLSKNLASLDQFIHFQCLFFLKLFIYLFLAVLGLRFCARAFSSCGKRGPLFIAVRGPLTIAASLVAEHRLQTRKLSSCGSRA